MVLAKSIRVPTRVAVMEACVEGIRETVASVTP